MVNILSAQFVPYLEKELDRLYEEKATGELSFTHRGNITTIFLLAGRLQYITEDQNRVRRWQRAIAKHCPNWDFPTKMVNGQPWECDFLYQGISKRTLTLDQAKSIITTVTKECLSELALFTQVKAEWVNHDRAKSTFSYFLSISPPEIHPILREIEILHQEWIENKLTELNPSLTPILLAKGETAIKNPAQKKYLNGQFTIWDIALKSKQSIAKVAKSLLPWQENGLIEFKVIKDLSQIIEDLPAVSSPAKISQNPTINHQVNSVVQSDKITLDRDNTKYLIACIDDSPIVIHNLKSILTPAGFQILSINEPMAGFGKLIEQKPDLILLDLNMPNANGYSVCKFLRESPVFEHTPIIILTAQDTSIDRARAKLVGANDFINKPPEPQALINLIHSYLSNGNKAKKNLAMA